MTTTNFPNGVTSWGIPLLGGGPGRSASGAPGTDLGVTSIIGNTWFVDTVFGSDGNPGNSPQAAFQTMERCFESLRSGDVINIRGRVSEQLVTPVQVFDVWVNGLGNQPRHADATPLGGQYAASQWGAPASGAVAGQATLRVLQQGWRFTNILFTAGDLTAACLELVRNAGAGNDERDASHAQVLGCRFSGAGIGIKAGVAGTFTELVYNVQVEGCQFDNMTEAIQGAIEVNQWKILGNNFLSCTSCIDLPARGTLIRGNVIGPFTAAANSGGIDLAGGAGLNIVTENFLSGTYSSAGGYTVANANDQWVGNRNVGVVTAEATMGVTTADPA